MADPDIVVIGAGAAGVGAGLRLRQAGADFVVLEAHDRIGGRAHTLAAPVIPGMRPAGLDFGCGWLHSAEDNPLVPLFEAAGLTIDRQTPPWRKPMIDRNFPREDQKDLYRAMAALNRVLDEKAEEGVDMSLAEAAGPPHRWSPLLDYFAAAFDGAPMAEMSLLDHHGYQAEGDDWRVREGYGAAVQQIAVGLPIRMGVAALRIDRSGPRLRVVTAQGDIACRAVIVCVPTEVLAHERLAFDPPLPDHVQAAHDLPLGAVAKIFLHLDEAGGWPEEVRFYGRTDTARTATYHLRPYGLPVIEGYFAGPLADELEHAGPEAFFDHTAAEVADALGVDRGRLAPMGASSWRVDPFIGGAFSHARIGRTSARQAIRRPVEDRIFFAGEHCSPSHYTTAHGAYESGVAAAEAALS